MLAACHLFVGVLIGLVLFKYLGDKRIVLLAALGSLLPDLIDKPLGHFLLQETVDFGRIYGHTLLFCLTFFLLGVLTLWRKNSFIAIAVSLGIASHLVLDLMWNLPVTLFYPALGDFGRHSFPHYFEISFLNEVLSPLEWLFLLLSIWVILRTIQSASSRRFLRLTSSLDRAANGLIVLLLAVASVYLILGAAGIISGPESVTVLSLTALLGGLLLRQMIKEDYAGAFKAKTGGTNTS